MTTITSNWDTSWTNSSVNGSTVTNGSNATTGAISNDLKSATEISVSVTYGATATEGINVYILRDTDGTNYEAVTDLPWGLAMPYSTSTTYRRTFTVAGDRISNFKAHITNDSGASVTATIKYRQAVVEVT